MKIIAIIQARMRSTRLPGKVLVDLRGASVLSRIVSRLRRASMIEQMAVATTQSSEAMAIVQACQDLQVAFFRGSESDVLNPYFQAAQPLGADAIVRIVSNCPLIDPDLVDEVIRAFIEQRADFACNILPRTYPRGLDTEVFSFEALERAWKISAEAHQREHVTPSFYERSDIFRLTSVRSEQDFSQYRWTLNTPEDLRLVRAIYGCFENRDDFSWRQVLSLMERLPELAGMKTPASQRPVRQDEEAF